MPQIPETPNHGQANPIIKSGQKGMVRVGDKVYEVGG